MKSNINKLPKISIIIPIYNSDEYITRCLNSILNQSLKNIEIILVNDLSTDQSEKIILRYKRNYSNIKYFSLSEKSGTGGARNVGLEYSTGDYISFVDSDDWIDTTMLEKMLNLLEKHEGEIAICGVLTEFHNSRSSLIRYEYNLENVLEGKFAIELLTRRFNQDISISPIVCNKIYKADFIKEKKLKFLCNCYNEDDAFNFISFLNANKIVITPDTYYHYFQRFDSTTHIFSKKHIEDLVLAFNEIKSYLISHSIYEEHKDNYFSFFEKCLYFVIDNLINFEKNYLIQNEYLKYFISISKNIIPVNDYIDYLGAMRLKNFLSPYNIK